MANASLHSISAALRYLDSLRIDILSEIAGKNLHESYSSPLSKDSANVLVLSDEANTLTLRGSEAYLSDFDDDVAASGLDNFCFGSFAVRWRRSATEIENVTPVTVEQLAGTVQRAAELLENVRAAAENDPEFRDRIRAAAREALWKVWINAETGEVLPAPQF